MFMYNIRMTIILTRSQFEQICSKSRMGQCEWFRTTYGCTLTIRSRIYFLEFKDPKQETFLD